MTGNSGNYGQSQEETIIVEVGADGALNLETIGFTGSGCEKEAQALSELLGTAIGIQHKPEYNQSSPNNHQGTRAKQRQF